MWIILVEVVSTKEDESDEDVDTVTSGNNGTVVSGKVGLRKPGEERNGTEAVPMRDQGEGKNFFVNFSEKFSEF